MTTASSLRDFRKLVALAYFLLAPIFSTVVCAAHAQQEPKAEKQNSQTASVAPSAEAQKPLPLKEALQKNKVLTEDDFHPQSGNKDQPGDDSREFNPICNPRCEQIVRDQMMSESDSELEFRNKFAVATQQIDDDHKWGNAVVAAVHAAEDYCGLERNRGQYAYPGATAPYTTDKLKWDFITKERDVWNKFSFAKGDLEVRIRDMRAKDPFRAVVMESQWAAALARSCHDGERL